MKNQITTGSIIAMGIVLILGGFKNAKVNPPIPEYKWRQVTTVESVVSGGMGRSRIIYTDDTGEMQEQKMQNFFSMTGINFGNINQNDIKITNMVSTQATEGWELFNVTSGVYSADKSTGIFITRYLFRKEK